MQCSPGIWQNKEWYDEVRLGNYQYARLYILSGEFVGLQGSPWPTS